jgi:hypothetical protein
MYKPGLSGFPAAAKSRFIFSPAGDPFYISLIAHYVLMTWVWSAFGSYGFLRLKGTAGCGKTRVLDVLKRLVYRGRDGCSPMKQLASPSTPRPFNRTTFGPQIGLGDGLGLAHVPAQLQGTPGRHWSPSGRAAAAHEACRTSEPR